MRFGVKTPLLSKHVPDLLYQVEPIARKKVQYKLGATKDVLSLIRRVAKNIPSEFWSDPKIFPCKDPKVLFELANLSEQPMPGVRWYGGDWFIVPQDNHLELLNKGRVVCSGSSKDLLSYVVSYASVALSCFVQFHRLGIIKFDKVEGTFLDKLTSFRDMRRLTPGLDRCSKVDELTYVDQDHVINKFMLTLDDWNEYQHRTVYHLGAGTNVSSSCRALGLFYERVVKVDPRLVEGVDSVKVTWQEIVDGLPPECDIVSDVAYGDKYGLVDEGLQELLDVLYGLSDNRLVIAKLSLGLDYAGKNGVVLCKPRPHNSEIIVRLTPDGEPLQPEMDAWAQKALAANEVRNTRILKHEFPDLIKPVFNTSEELGRLARLKHPPLPRPGPNRLRRVRRTVLLVEAVDGRGLEKRRKEWRKAVKRRFVEPGPFCILPTYHYLVPGNLLNCDPLIGDVQTSLRSLLKTAEYQRFVPFYEGCWRIRNDV